MCAPRSRLAATGGNAPWHALERALSEKRRARLARKFDRLDRLETRNTITEPISVMGLSVTALRGLAQLGMVQVHGGGDALEALEAASQAARQQDRRRGRSPPTSDR